MVELGSSRLQGSVAYALRIFGRPPRTTACDLRTPAMEPALPQTLFRMTDAAVLAEVRGQGRARAETRQDQDDDEELVEEAFLRDAVRASRRSSNWPTALEHLKGAKNRTEGVTDLIWGVGQYAAGFILNH